MIALSHRPAVEEVAVEEEGGRGCPSFVPWFGFLGILGERGQSKAHHGMRKNSSTATSDPLYSEVFGGWVVTIHVAEILVFYGLF